LKAEVIFFANYFKLWIQISLFMHLGPWQESGRSL